MKIASSLVMEENNQLPQLKATGTLNHPNNVPGASLLRTIVTGASLLRINVTGASLLRTNVHIPAPKDKLFF